MIIIQIGANKGNDDLTKIINNEQPDLLILVEPFKLHNENLKKNYSWVNNFHVENLAISDITGDEIDFYYHLDDGPSYEVASLDPKHIYEKHKHLSENKISSFKVKTCKINDLFDKYNLIKINILYIDAEGYDDKIIKTINFKKYDIDEIYFENLHLQDPTIYSLLESIGYVITKNTGHNGWSSLAKKLKK
jgi:FkbM family methyltransferase